MTMRPAISVVFRNPQAFARSRDESASADALFLPRLDLEVGQAASVWTRFAAEGESTATSVEASATAPSVAGTGG